MFDSATPAEVWAAIAIVAFVVSALVIVISQLGALALKADRASVSSVAPKLGDASGSSKGADVGGVTR